MSEFLEYDPANGIKYEIDEYDGKEHMRKTQDLQGLVDLNKGLANMGACDQGIKNGMWHVCNVPDTIWLELKKQGYDLFTNDDKMFWVTLRKIQKDYPYLKTTHKSIA